MQYFLTYNLGLLKPSNKKADQGSAVHKVMEWLAIGKQYLQENPDSDTVVIEDMTFPVSAFYEEYKLGDLQVDAINRSRTAKSIYKTDASINYGHTRMGVDVVEELLRRSCEYYASKCVEPWQPANYRDCTNWAWMILDYMNGIYDPRKRTIFSPEFHFEIDIDKEWAEYEFLDENGEKFTGKYGIKGTVDLITELDSDTLEIVDWKTGQRLDWATGEEKTYEKISKDIQLMMYYYAISKSLPQYKNIIITIFFVRDGGPFTVSFDTTDLPTVENKLRQHFEEVKNTELPSMCSPSQTGFKCERLCSYYKDVHPDGNQNTCRHIHNHIKQHGLQATIEKYKDPGFSFGHYSAPGS